MAGKYAHAEFVGLDQLLQKLDNVSGELLMSASRKGLEKTMTKMRDDARKNCPEDTGELRNKIHYTTKVIASHVRGELVSSAEHAIFVEMGTGPKGEAGVGSANVSPQIRKRVTYNARGWFTRNEKNGKPVESRGMEPRPYLYPAYKTYERKVHEDVRAEIYKAIREEGIGE